jgi:hypothetical protein
MSEDDYRRWRAEADAEETQRVDRLSAFVESRGSSAGQAIAASSSWHACSQRRHSSAQTLQCSIPCAA